MVNYIEPNLQEIIFGPIRVGLITQKQFWDHFKNCHGVFVCMTCNFILNDYALVFDQSHLDQCRDKILVSILNGIPTALYD